MLVIRLAIALVAVVAAARAMRPLCRLAGQPPVVADMAAGILLGPSFLGWAAPAVTAWLFAPAALAPLAQVAQVGVVLGLMVGTFEERSSAWMAPVFAATFVVGMLVVVRPAVGRVAASGVGEGPLGLPLALAAVLAVAFLAEAAGGSLQLPACEPRLASSTA